MNRLEWNKYDWSQFETICFRYLKTIYTSRFFKVVLTPKKKDGGKDIIITKRDLSYIAWGECKNHTRNVDLSVIGKNIVLALSHKIQKAIVFSVSAITASTKIEILNVSQAHGFDVQFLDGTLLDDAIMRCPSVAKRYFPQAYFEQQNNQNAILWANCLLSEYEFVSDLQVGTEKRQYQLRNGSDIYIHVFLKNISGDYISEVRLSLHRISNKLLFYKVLHTIDSIKPYTDILLTFRGIALLPDKNIPLPELHITYFQNEEKHIQSTKIGELDTSEIWLSPFVGEKVNRFLNVGIETLLDVIDQRYTKCLYISGPSGVGKSRLLCEIKNKSQEQGFRVYVIDFLEYDNGSAICYLFQRILYLPATCGVININHSEFTNVLQRYQCIEEEIDILFEFLFRRSQNISYSALAQIFCKIVVNALSIDPILLLFDNVQSASENSQLFLWEIATRLKQIDVGILLAFASRSEFFGIQKNIIVNYLYADCLSDGNYVKHFRCDILSDEDAANMLKNLLHLGNESDLLVKHIIAHIGGRPIDVLLIAKSIFEKDGILEINQGRTLISDAFALNALLNNVTGRLEGAIERRLADNTLQSAPCIRIISIVKFFCGSINSCILHNLGYGNYDLEILVKALILKYNPITNIFTFYHDTIEAFVSASAKYTPSPEDLEQIVQWYTCRDSRSLFIPQYIFFFALVYLQRIDEACMEGQRALSRYQEAQEYKVALRVADALLGFASNKLPVGKLFEVKFAKASLTMREIGIQQGRIEFDKLHSYVLKNMPRISKAQLIKFYHNYANSKLHNMLYEDAIVVLEEFEENVIHDDLIIHDRLCVAYFSLGEIKKAIEHIDRVIMSAQANHDFFWLSTAYSDKAFTYFVNTEDVDEICSLFDMMEQTHIKAGVNYNYRRIEVAIQTALKYTLESRLTMAWEKINDAINIAESESDVYLLVPALNLSAVILVKEGKYDQAKDVLNNSLMRAISFSLDKSLVAIYSSLGNIAMLQSQHEKQEALHFYISAEKIIKKLCSRMTCVRFHPCIASMMRAYWLLGFYERAEDLLSVFYCERLRTYYDNSVSVQRTSIGEESLGFGNLTYHGYSFIY